MIGRADIEGSKSNVDLNSWLPQASYPYGNFSDTSRIKKMVIYRVKNHNIAVTYPSKGSIGHTFIVIIFTEHHNQFCYLAFSSTKGFCPF